MKKIITILLVLLLLMTAAVYADGIEVKAEIPVTCIGETGTFVLLDESGEVDRITLGGGTGGTLGITLKALDYFTFTVRQVDMDEPNVDYDRTEYTVDVVTILDENDEPVACISVYEGEDGKKVEEIIFRNFNNDIPKTGDENSLLLWGCLLAAASAGIIMLILPLKRKERKGNEKG